jgi:hypothetical protein
MIRSGFFAVAVLCAVATAAKAQTVYEPVRYQYGQHQEIYYGGTNAAITSGNYVYLPAHLEEGARARRYNAPVYPYPSPYMIAGPNTAFVSPYTSTTTITYPVTSFIFSDYLPYEEVGQFGYTIDDARNEASANVPRYQTGARAAGTGGTMSAYAAPAAAPAPGPAPRIANPREKAMALINWAKAERRKNGPLYQALMTEARKYDPAAVAAAERAR